MDATPYFAAESSSSTTTASEAGEARLDSLLDGISTQLEHAVSMRIPPDAEFHVREAAVLALQNEATRRFLQRALMREAEKFRCDRLLVDDVPHRRHELGRATYHSLVGPLEVDRSIFRACGRRNGATVDPVALQAGLIEGMTPALAFCVARGYAHGTSRELEKGLLAAHRRPPSRATIERSAKRVGTASRRAEGTILRVLREEETVPSTAYAISFGLDRTTIPMEEDIPGRPRKRTRKRRSRGRVTVNYRMAYVATIAILDREGETLLKRQHACSAASGSGKIFCRILADLHAVLRKRPDLQIVVVQDAAAELWGLVWEHFKADPVLRKKGWTEVIDWYHIVEHLARVAEALDAKTQRAARLERWKGQLRKRDRAIEDILAEITEEARVKGWSREKKYRALHGHTNVLSFPGHVRYASLLQRGLPIGSGVTEGACKSLVTMRTKRSGQRWRPEGVESVLSLRALEQSDRLDRYWSRFRKRYQRVILAEPMSELLHA